MLIDKYTAIADLERLGKKRFHFSLGNIWIAAQKKKNAYNAIWRHFVELHCCLSKLKERYIQILLPNYLELITPHLLLLLQLVSHV